MYNLMSTILHHLQHRPSFLEVQKTPRRRKKKWAHQTMLLWFPIPAALGFCGIAQSVALYIARHPKRALGLAKVTSQIKSEVGSHSKSSN